MVEKHQNFIFYNIFILKIRLKLKNHNIRYNVFTGEISFKFFFVVKDVV